MFRFFISALLLSTALSLAQAPGPQLRTDADALAQAHQLLEQGEVEKALTALKAIQARNEPLKGLDRELGVAYSRQSGYLRASVILEKATAADTKDKEAVQLLGLS